MCLILIAYKSHPKYPLILLANRDEYYQRATAQACYWHDFPQILGGRDLQAGGTWMAIHKKGKLAAVTNYRTPNNLKTFEKSRGALVTNYLSGKETSHSYIQNLVKSKADYAGYNLLLGDINQLQVYSNISDQIYEVQPGIHGLSNRFLNSDWYKVRRSKRILTQLIKEDEIDRELFLKLLQDKKPTDSDDLPNTGLPIELERMLSPIFIESPHYGTRCSTIIKVDKSNRVYFFEMSYGEEYQSESVEFEFQLPSD